MPRFDPIDPRKQKRNKTSDFIDSAKDVNVYGDQVYGKNRRGFGAFTEMFTRQQKNSAGSPEIILEKLEPIWERSIEPVLIREFGRRSTLYIIFYQGKNREQIIMEIWDPKYVNQKESQVFSIEGVPEYVTRYFPKNRSQAEIGVLADWD
jgi:hypothetical protein